MMKKPISYDKPPYMSNTSRSWERGLLTDQKTYNEDNKIKTWMHYEYEINPVDFSPRKIEGLALYSSKSQSYMANSITSYDVDYGTYSIESKWLYIKQTRERVYHQTDASKYIETVKDFTFNVNNLQVAQITETTSEGKSLITKLRYPVDYSAASEAIPLTVEGVPTEGQINGIPVAKDLAAITNEMRFRNIVSPIIERQVWEKDVSFSDGTCVCLH